MRTRALTRVWQSYRAEFVAGPDWQRIDLPLADFRPHRTDIALDLRQVHRIGLVAIGAEMQADLALVSLALVA